MESSCPECDNDLVSCQFCSVHCCDFGNCGGKLNMCEGEGCSRANCLEGECFDDNEGSQVCVRYYEDDEENHTFCGDCWEKNRGGGRENNTNIDEDDLII